MCTAATTRLALNDELTVFGSINMRLKVFCEFVWVSYFAEFNVLAKDGHVKRDCAKP